MFDVIADLVSERTDPSELDHSRWPEITAAAGRHGLAPVLHAILKNHNALRLLPPDARQILSAISLQVEAANSLAYHAILEWSQHFADLDVPALWIKGAALGLTVYPDFSLRPMTDVDVLISAQDLPAIEGIIRETAQSKTSNLPRGIDRHAVAQVGPGGLVRMELHWSLVDLPGLEVTEDVGWFLAQRQPLPLAEMVAYILTPEAHLLYLCAHAEILHGASDFLLLRYFDLHRLVICSPALSWPAVVDRAVEFRWTYAVERALAITERFFATPLPEGLLDELRRRRPAGEDITRVTRHQAAAKRGQKLLNRFAGLSWPARLRLAAGLAFPSPTYMRQRYALDAGWKVPLYYPYRWLDTATQVGKALGEDVSARIAPRAERR